MIKEKLAEIYKRGKPIKYQSYATNDRGRKIKEYDYLICDRCGDKIPLIKPKQLRKGGTVTLSYVITKYRTIELALCSKCINPTLKEFE